MPTAMLSVMPVPRAAKWLELGRRVEAARNRKGLTQDELALKVVTSQATVSAIERGTSSGRKHLTDLARILDVPREWITSGHPRQAWEEPPPPSDWQTHRVLMPAVRYDRSPVVPIVTRSQGSVLVQLPEPAPDEDRPPYRQDRARELAMVGTVTAGDGLISYETEPRAFGLRPGWVVMRVEGSSAYPVVYPNQFVIVDIDRPVRHNNLVIVQTNDGKAFLKRYCVALGAPSGYILASVNSGIDSPYIPAGDILVMRPVVGVLFEE